MIYCSHRINTVKQLINTNTEYGIEIDLRDDLNGNVYIAHDPFINGELFDEFLKHYNHSFIILNIKSERIEYKVLELIQKYNIKNYFFLDSSFPMIYKLSCHGERNIAIRFSEYEGLDTILSMKGKVDWVWVDCFTKNPLTRGIYQILKNAGFKLCFVSPELQNQNNKLNEYKNYFSSNDIVLDMICTKEYNIEKWQVDEQTQVNVHIVKYEQVINDVQIVIPMSGVGQRFIDAGYKDPKPLIMVDDKPIIEHVVNLFQGEKDVTFICNEIHLENTNMSQVLETICPTSRIFNVPNDGREGPVHAVSLVFDKIDDNKEVIVSYCDYGTDWNYDEFLKDTRCRDADGAVACYKGFHPHMLGTDNYAFLRETTQGTRWMDCIQEKTPFTDNRMNEWASNGTYYFKTGAIMKRYFQQLMDLKQKVKNEYYVSMVYNLLVEDNLKVSIFGIDHMLQWGTPYDLEVYQDWSNYFNNITIKQKSYKDELNTTLILPMAGAGSRFSKMGYSLPKPLIDVNGLPMIIQAVNCLPDTTHKVFICLEEHIKTYSGLKSTLETNYNRCDIIPINDITEGQACTTEIGIVRGKINIENPCLISACDNGVYYDKDEYEKLLKDETIDVIVWSFSNHPTSRNKPSMYAWLETDDNDFVKSVSCKKFIEGVHDVKNSHVIIGTMFFRKGKYFMEGLKANYRENIRSNCEFYVDDVINQNIKNGLKVKSFVVNNYICWGTPDDYETYCYWQTFFDKCSWHEYKKDKDTTSCIV